MFSETAVTTTPSASPAAAGERQPQVVAWWCEGPALQNAPDQIYITHDRSSAESFMRLPIEDCQVRPLMFAPPTPAAGERAKGLQAAYDDKVVEIARHLCLAVSARDGVERALRALFAERDSALAAAPPPDLVQRARAILDGCQDDPRLLHLLDASEVLRVIRELLKESQP